GVNPSLSPANTEVLQEMRTGECHFINGTDRVRAVQRHIYNRRQYVHFDSDVGHYVGDTPYGAIQARYWNSDPQWMEYVRSAVDTVCRPNYEGFSPFSVNRRVPPSPFHLQSQSIPSPSQ
ncbi:HB2L protein, partial [Campylorhamphus procurvoides]|nr:HB2L protein [Campylorhamphus procurvoides]